MTLQQTALAAMAAFTLAAVAACAPAPANTPAPDSSTPAHGYVAGATEAGEAQSLLPYLSAPSGTLSSSTLPSGTLASGTLSSGTLSIVDPLSGEESFTASIPGASAMANDGRYVFVHTAATGRVHIIDTGVWTVEHGDHKHFYRSATTKLEGELSLGAGPVVGDGHHVALFEEETGKTSLLSRETLDSGVIRVESTIPGTPHRGLAVPYKGHVLVTGSPGQDKLPTTISAFDAAGAGEKVLATTCPSLMGHASTRYGVVFGCSDGVLLVHDDGGSLTSTKIPYPGTAPSERITAFDHRPGSSELVSLAGTAGLWHLDVATAKLQFIPSPEPLSVSTTAGNGSPALGVGRSGTLYAFTTLTGTVESQRKLLPEIGLGAPPSLLVNANRAYLSHPATQTIHEIDYRDKLRVARAFATTGTTSQLAETGL